MENITREEVLQGDTGVDIFGEVAGFEDLEAVCVPSCSCGCGANGGGGQGA